MYQCWEESEFWWEKTFAGAGYLTLLAALTGTIANYVTNNVLAKEIVLINLTAYVILGVCALVAYKVTLFLASMGSNIQREPD